MKIARLSFVIIAALWFASCCACRKGAVKALPLQGTQWSLIEWNGRPFVSEGNYCIEFSDEGRFSGRGDCNSIMGDYKVTEDRKLGFGSVASTRMMCPNQEQEGRFVRMLESIDSYDIDGNMLMLFHDGELIGIMEGRR